MKSRAGYDYNSNCLEFVGTSRFKVTHSPYCLDRKGADNDFDTCRKLGMPLKSVSPDQPPGWNDPYRIVEFWAVSRRVRLLTRVISRLKKEGGAITQPRLSLSTFILDQLLLNFLLNAASPTRPEARRSMVAGQMGPGFLT